MTKDSTRKWLFALLLGLIIWSFLFITRIQWYTPWCAVTPTPCLADQVNALDRIVFQFRNVQADFWSNVIQNFVGLVAFIAPWLIFSRKIALHETLITGTISFANLACLEITRTLVQRPRPLVFQGVLTDGANIHSYTSFYSGHTSFVALASLSFFFIMKRRFSNLSKTVHNSLIAAYLLLTITTGVLRVLGGRHYPTDVVVGMIMGSVIALFIQKKH
jgi:membrane-associated phospholipid phosphatase